MRLMLGICIGLPARALFRLTHSNHAGLVARYVRTPLKSCPRLMSGNLPYQTHRQRLVPYPVSGVTIMEA